MGDDLFGNNVLALQTPPNATLPYTFCPSCATQVIVYRDLDQAGELVAFCLDCDTQLDAPIDEDQGWTPAEAEEAGYVVEGALDQAPKEGGCGSGGCSSGRCSD